MTRAAVIQTDAKSAHRRQIRNEFNHQQSHLASVVVAGVVIGVNFLRWVRLDQREPRRYRRRCKYAKGGN